MPGCDLGAVGKVVVVEDQVHLVRRATLSSLSRRGEHHLDRRLARLRGASSARRPHAGHGTLQRGQHVRPERRSGRRSPLDRDDTPARPPRRADRCSHAASSVVLPNPAGAETSVSGASAAWANRSVSRGPGHQAAAQPWAQTASSPPADSRHPRSPRQRAGADGSRCACTCIRSPGRPKMLSTSAGLCRRCCRTSAAPGCRTRPPRRRRGRGLVAEDQPHPTGEHVQPLVTRRGCVGCGVDCVAGTTIFQACTPPGPGQRQHGAAVDPARLEPDPRVADLRGAHQVVHGHPVGLRQRQQQLQARAPLPGLQPRQGALGDAGRPAASVSVTRAARGPAAAADRPASRVAAMRSTDCAWRYRTASFPGSATPIVTVRFPERRHTSLPR